MKLIKILLITMIILLSGFSYAYEIDRDEIECEINPSDSCTDFLLQKTYGPKWIMLKDLYFEFIDNFRKNNREEVVKIFTYPLSVLVEKDIYLHPETYQYEYDEYIFYTPDDLLKNYDNIFLEETKQDMEKFEYKNLLVHVSTEGVNIIGQFLEVYFAIACKELQEISGDPLECKPDNLYFGHLKIMRKKPEAEI